MTRLPATAVLGVLVLGACSGPAGQDHRGATSTPAPPSSASTAAPRSEPSPEPQDPYDRGPGELAAALADASALATSATVTFAKTDVLTYSLVGSGVVDFEDDPYSIDLDYEVDGGTGYELVSVAGNGYVSTPAMGGTFAPISPTDTTSPAAVIRAVTDFTSSRLQDAVTSVAMAPGRIGDGRGQVFVATLEVPSLPPGIVGGLTAGRVAESATATWTFDRSGLLRRVELDLGDAAEGFRIEFADWGRPVDIVRPSVP